jgi:hypothetical protein
MINQGGIAAQNLFILYGLPFIPGSLPCLDTCYATGYHNWILMIHFFWPQIHAVGGAAQEKTN